MMNGTFLKFFHTLCLIGQFANLEEPNELLVFPRGLFVNVFFSALMSSENVITLLRIPV